jgi:hypothetical protein
MRANLVMEMSYFIAWTTLLLFYGYQLDMPLKSTVDGKQQDCGLY